MSKEVITSPLDAIRANCIQCCGGSPKEVSLCSIERCPLHPFRFGKNPFRKTRELSEEEKAALAERLARGRQATIAKNP